MIKAVCFDLFHTLIDPHIELIATESEPLGISAAQWEGVHWDETLSQERGLGKIKTQEELIERLCALLPFTPSAEQKAAVLKAKQERMRRCLTEVPSDMIETVRALKNHGIKIGLVSNADVCDIASWGESPLARYFDDAIFSCYVGVLKPERAIYEMSLSHLGESALNALFVGDGGSDELFGAKAVGMKTVLTECLVTKEEERRKNILKSADFCITDFKKVVEIALNA